MDKRYYFFNVEHCARLPDFFPFWRPHPRQFSGHFTKIATDSALISWIFLNFDKCRLKNSIIALVPPIGTKKPNFGVLAHGLVGHEVPGVVVWPLLLYCEILGDISSYKATLQSEGKESIHFTSQFTFQTDQYIKTPKFFFNLFFRQVKSYLFTRKQIQ